MNGRLGWVDRTTRGAFGRSPGASVKTVEPGDRLLRRLVRDGGGWTVTLAAVALLGAVAELLLPITLGRAVDAALSGGSVRWPAIACGLVVLVIATDTLTGLSTGYGAARATARLRQGLLRHLFALDNRTVERYPVGDLVGRLTGQSAEAGQAGAAVVLGCVALIAPLGSVVALTLLEPWLGVTLIAGLLVLALLMRAFVTDSSQATAGYQQAQGRIAGRLTESLSGARTLAASATVDREVDRVLTPLPELHAYGLRGWQLLARAAARTTALAWLLRLAVIAVGGYALTEGWLSPGELVAAVQYAALAAGAGGVLAALHRLVRSRAGARRAAEVLVLPAPADGDETLPPGPGALHLDRVTVRTPDGRAILREVELVVPGGSTMAVVGASGAGKSTLAAVAGRLHDPDEGEVSLDGVPLRRLSRASLARAVGYGFERPALVGETVRDAIGLGLPPVRQPTDPTDDRATDRLVERSARAASVHDWVTRLPEGYRTRLAEAPLSGGEAQRLGLARALHAERLLILDDATSSVDTATEHRIVTAMTGHPNGRTRLVVTHRVATAAAADLVAWLDQGRLRAVAPHHRLWDDPDYRAIFQPVGVRR